VAGLAAAAVGGTLLRSLLYGIVPLDAPAFAAAVLIVLIVSAGAAWRPARRALVVDPAQALRAE
jgi:ABC-type lipoprotein release transport system permease subunit